MTFAVSKASFIVVAMTPAGPRLIQPLQYRPVTYIQQIQRLKCVELSMASHSYSPGIRDISPKRCQMSMSMSMDLRNRKVLSLEWKNDWLK